MIDRIILVVLLLNLAGYNDCKKLKKEGLQKELLSVKPLAQYYCDTPECKQEEEKRDRITYERFAQFHCTKLLSCTKGGEKVCGYDIRSTNLAYFSDRCQLYTANCNRAGMYYLAKQATCDTKKNYTVSFDDEFQFEPIIKRTEAPGNAEIIKGNVDYTFVRAGNHSKKVGLGLVQLVNGEI